MRGGITGLVLAGIVVLGLTAASVFVWMAEDDVETAAGDATVTASAEQIDLGRTVFQAKGCIGCHQIADVAGGRSIGPDLTLLPEQAGSRIEGTSAEAYVTQSIAAPQAYIVSGYGYGMQEMPQIPMSQAEMDALVVYLLSEHEFGVQ